MALQVLYGLRLLGFIAYGLGLLGLWPRVPGVGFRLFNLAALRDRSGFGGWV